MRTKPVKERIPDVFAAWRCIYAVERYLKEHESPLAAEDLMRAILLVRQKAASIVERSER